MVSFPEPLGWSATFTAPDKQKEKEDERAKLANRSAGGGQNGKIGPLVVKKVASSGAVRKPIIQRKGRGF